MSFVSYAQNREDIMLWRALGHVQAGFYIDVGANHPEFDSVTKAFYDRGWSGINIEPLADHAAQLAAARPRDINLACAVGAQEGETKLFESDIRGHATAAESVAEMHRREGQLVRTHRVAMRRLSQICAEHAPAEIHFLKIDVEGYEENVLHGMDFCRYRPWIVLVEATQPNSRQLHVAWEPLLLNSRYRFAYFDGLNRFYVADEHLQLLTAFQVPPNVFDDFIPLEQVRLKHALQQTHAALEQAQSALAQMHQAAQQDIKQKIQPTGFRPLTLLQRLPRAMKKRWGGFWHRLIALTEQTTSSHAPPTAQHQQPQDLHQDRSRQPAHFFYQAFPTWPTSPQNLSQQIDWPQHAETHWLRLLGHIQGHYSLAIVNRRLARAMETLLPGRIMIDPCDHEAADYPRDLPEHDQQMLLDQMRRRPPAADSQHLISLVHHYPLILDSQPAGQRLAVFFWEETFVPKAMVDHINAHFQGVFVASRFVKKALRDSGCRLPIWVIGFGVDHVLEHVSDGWVPQSGSAQIGAMEFRFLHVSSAFERKGVDVLLKAFFSTFTHSDGVVLTIKTFPNPHNTVHAQLQALRRQYPQGPLVVVDEQPLSDAQMVALYRSADVVVLPSRGEGFNLPAAEAMALGIPVITTGHGGHADFCSRQTAQLIPYRFAHSESHLAGPDACWIEPDAQYLAGLMRETVQRQRAGDTQLKRLRDNALTHVRATYRWPIAAREMLAACAWLAKQDSASPFPARIALLGPWASRCGVATYAQGLFESLISQGRHRLEVYCDQRTTPDAAASQPISCQPTWQLGDEASVLQTLERIASSGYQVLVVQHQPSLFRLNHDVCDRLARIAESGCIVVLELHATEQLLFEHRLSGASTKALQRLDRIVVHQLADLNNLLALGLLQNVMLLPHSMVQPLPGADAPCSSEGREAHGIPADALVIASFGFAFAHKGIDTLVQTITPLMQGLNRQVYLLCVNATPNPESARLIAEYQAMARAVGVGDRIRWFTEFLPIDECQRLLSLADYIVLPYKHTRESASGAVSLALSSRRPVLVSPLNIFEDLGPVTHRLAADTVDAIVQGITALDQQPEQIALAQSRLGDWLAQRSTGVLMHRLTGLLQGLHIDRRLRSSSRAPDGVAFAGAGEPKQLLVDVSEIYFRDSLTGIQRVVRSILAGLLREPPFGYRVRPVFATVGEPYRYTKRFSVDCDGQLQIEPLPQMPPQPAATAVAAGPGDIFLGLDLAAHLFPGIEAQIEAFRQAGARVHFVVYDLIPLMHPQFCHEGITAAFDQWMRSLARRTDGLHCISAAVAQDVRAWLLTHARDLPLPEVHHFHLGADLERSTPTRGVPADAQPLLKRLSDHRLGQTFLMVSTIEPRKGHQQVLEAFEALWQAGSGDRLVFVGKAGWKMESFIERICRHSELGQKFFWLQGISDEYLEKIYRASTSLIAASVAEGFGLPLIEAAQRGLPIIARDIPVFREVAGSHAFYFSADVAEDLAKAIDEWKLLFAQGQAPVSSGMAFLTWNQSVSALLANLCINSLQEDYLKGV